MAIDIIVDSMYGRTRLAVMEDGRLREMYTWGAWKTYCRVCRPHL